MTMRMLTREVPPDTGDFAYIPAHAEDSDSEEANDVLDASPSQQRARHILHNTAFQIFMATVILANGVLIGVETDMKEVERSDWMEEDGFLIIFAAEVVLRLYAFGPSGFFALKSKDFVWNAFDFSLVSMGVFDLLHRVASGSESGGGVWAMLRLLRILRVVRILKFLRQLYMLVHGLIEAIKAIGWVTSLMALFLYGCSVVLVRTVGSLPSEEYRDLTENFSSIPRSMLTLFMLMVSPVLDKYEPFFEEFPLLCAFMIFYSIFGAFGMIALLTGVISESMFDKNQLRLENERIDKETLHERLKILHAEMFENVSKTHCGRVKPKDLGPLVRSIAKLLEKNMICVTLHDLNNMLTYMDMDGDGLVTEQEFLDAVLQMAEGVRPIAMMETLYSVRECRRLLENDRRLLEKIDARLARLEGRGVDGPLDDSGALTPAKR